MQNYRNSLTWLLLVVFLFAQVLPVTAAGTQYQDPNANATPQTPSFANNSGSAVLSTADQLSNYYLTQYKNSYDWDWLRTTNINFSAFSGNTPQWNINTFQPFGFSDDQGKFMFNSLESMKSLDRFGFLQAQYGTGNNTFNLGLGYRTMNAKHSKLYGFNLFYDVQASIQGIGGYNPSGAHQRLGAGFEYFAGSVETRLNGYYGVSSDVQVSSVNTSNIATFQHVAPGLDLSVGTDFSFWNAPWFKLTATGNYYAQTQCGTINGYNGSALNANLTAQLQVTPQLSINGGGTVGNGGQSNGNIGFQFNLLAPPTPALFMADPTTNKLAETDISYKMLQQVQRNNTITVEQYDKNVGNLQSVNFAFVDEFGDPLAGADVTATVTSVTGVVSANTFSAVTNSLGIANFNLPAGAAGTLLAQTGVATMASTYNLKTVPTPPAKTFDLSNFGKQAIDKAAFDVAAAAAGIDPATATIGTSNAGNGVPGNTVKVAQLPVKNGNYVMNGMPNGTFPTFDINAAGNFTQFAANLPSANPAAPVDPVALAAALNGPSSTSLNLSAKFTNGNLAKGTKVIQITANDYANMQVIGSQVLDSGTLTIPAAKITIPQIPGITTVNVTITSQYKDQPMIAQPATLTLSKQNTINLVMGSEPPAPGTGKITVAAVSINGTPVTTSKQIGFYDIYGNISEIKTFIPGATGGTVEFNGLTEGVYMMAVFNSTTRTPEAIDIYPVPIEVGSNVNYPIVANSTGAYDVNITGLPVGTTGAVTISNKTLPQIVDVVVPFTTKAVTETVTVSGMPLQTKSLISVASAGYAQQTFYNQSVHSATVHEQINVPMATTTVGTVVVNPVWPPGSTPRGGKAVLTETTNPNNQTLVYFADPTICKFPAVPANKAYNVDVFVPGTTIPQVTTDVITEGATATLAPQVTQADTGNITVNFSGMQDSNNTTTIGTVTLTSSDGQTTYDEGQFYHNTTLTFTNVPTGNVVITTALVDGSAYAITSVNPTTVTVAKNQTIGSYVTLAKGTITGTISGTTATGVVATLDGAVITPVWSGLNYTIANVAMGTHTLVLSKPTYTAAPATQSVNIANATAVAATPVVFTLTPTTGIVSGTVTNAAGTGIVGVTVAITNAADPLHPLQATTGANGAYTFINVIPGTYAIGATATGYIPYVNTTPFAVAANTTVNRTFAMTANVGTITGSVTGPAGFSTTGIIATVAGVPVTPVWNGLNYTIANVAYGTKSVVFTKPLYTANPLTQNVAVPAGGSVVATTVAFTLTPTTGIVSGIVTNASGAGIVGATVAITSAADPLHPLQATTGANGAYTFTSVTPGTYVIGATATGYQAYVNTTPFAVAADVTVTKSFAMTANPTTGTVSGIVTNASGAGIVGATVAITSAADPLHPLQATTGANGAYTFTSVTPGNYVIGATATGYQAYVNTTPFAVAAGVTVTKSFAMTANPTTGTVSGIVTNASGAGIVGATVVLAVPDSPIEDWLYTTTAAGGTYTFNSVIPATYMIAAQMSGYSDYVSTPFVVAANTIVTRSFAMTAAVTLSGTVLDQSNAPLAGVTVTIQYKTATTNAQGVYTFDAAAGLTKTDYYGVPISFTKNGYTESYRQVIVLNYGANTCNQSMTANPTTGTVSGVVTSGTGGVGIVGATVAITNTADPAHPLTTTTTTGGNYTISSVTPGNYMIGATATGYQAYVNTTPFAVAAGATATQSFAMTPTAPTTGGITGAISGADGTSGTVLVKVDDVAPAAGTLSWTSATNYTITSLTPGPHTVAMTKSGYNVSPTSQSITVVAGVNTQAGQTFAFTLTPSQIIINGLGTGGASYDYVVLVDNNDNIVSAEVPYNATQMILPAPSSGSYYVMAHSPSGWLGPYYELIQPSDMAAGGAVQVATRTAPYTTLVPASQIANQIQIGTTAVGVPVTMGGYTSTALGKANIFGLPFAKFFKMPTGGTATINAPTQYAAGPAHTMDYSKIASQGRAWNLPSWIDGKATVGGYNIPGANISLIDSTGATVYTTTTDSSGNYHLPGIIMPGYTSQAQQTYTVRISYATYNKDISQYVENVNTGYTVNFVF
ncbi:MAG: carboxypeptidase regulatory-like domain-containing protein [Bacillota bacterium]